MEAKPGIPSRRFPGAPMPMLNLEQVQHSPHWTEHSSELTEQTLDQSVTGITDKTSWIFLRGTEG